MRDKWWSCGRKIRFKTRETAEKEIKRIKKTGRIIDAVIYECEWCGGFHHAHKRRRKK